MDKSSEEISGKGMENDGNGKKRCSSFFFSHRVPLSPKIFHKKGSSSDLTCARPLTLADQKKWVLLLTFFSRPDKIYGNRPVVDCVHLIIYSYPVQVLSVSLCLHKTEKSKAQKKQQKVRPKNNIHVVS